MCVHVVHIYHSTCVEAKGKLSRVHSLLLSWDRLSFPLPSSGSQKELVYNSQVSPAGSDFCRIGALGLQMHNVASDVLQD